MGARDDNRLGLGHHLLFLMPTVYLELSGCLLIIQRGGLQVVQWQNLPTTHEIQEDGSNLSWEDPERNSNPPHG